MKQKFITLLQSTGRANIDRVIAELEKTDFFRAPASTVFHGNYPGGLLNHSVKVAECALRLCSIFIEQKPELAEKLPEDSVIIAALLHDVCKANVYQVVTKKRQNQEGKWETYEAYSPSYKELPLGHGEKSVVRLLRWGLDLTDDELLAIRWHMGAWDLAMQNNEAKTSNSEAHKQAPLAMLIQASDELSSTLLE